MTTKFSHNDATSMASTQVSIAEFLDDSVETTDETETEADSHEDGIYSRIVYASKKGDRYHKVRAGIVPACPTIDGEQITLGEAKDRGLWACGVCGPVEYPRDETEIENTTMEGFL